MNEPTRLDAQTQAETESKPQTLQTPDGAAPAGDLDALKQAVIEMLSTITDPEIPVNIYELGLIYEVEVTGEGDVRVIMTLTTPNCPVAESMPGEVEYRVGTVPGVRAVTVELVWEPTWTPDRMSEAAKLELGFI
jgi:FeS assembly SUF system protein